MDVGFYIMPVFMGMACRGVECGCVVAGARRSRWGCFIKAPHCGRASAYSIFSSFCFILEILFFSQIACLSDMAFHNLRCFLVFTVLREGELWVYSVYVTGAVVKCRVSVLLAWVIKKVSARRQ